MPNEQLLLLHLYDDQSKELVGVAHAPALPLPGAVVQLFSKPSELVGSKIHMQSWEVQFCVHSMLNVAAGFADRASVEAKVVMLPLGPPKEVNADLADPVDTRQIRRAVEMVRKDREATSGP